MGETRKFETLQYKDAQTMPRNTAGQLVGALDLYVTCGVKECGECAKWKLQNVGYRFGSFLMSSDHTKILKQCGSEETRKNSDRVIYEPQMGNNQGQRADVPKELNRKEMENEIYLREMAEKHGITWDECAKLYLSLIKI
ncbi:hypothetical protein ACOME3_008755 [Neoechinorhynchus agilis]